MKLNMDKLFSMTDKRANDLLLACGFIKWRAKKLNMDTNSWSALGLWVHKMAYQEAQYGHQQLDYP
jgi:hypothetical protein